MFIIALFLIPLPWCFTVSAGECQYGTLSAWFSLDGVNWKNATVHNAPLRLGQAFYIKATLSAKVQLMAIAVELWETGEGDALGSSFELLEGPECFYRFIPDYHIRPGNSSAIIWRFQVKQDLSWRGNAPLNIQANFNVDEYNSDEVYFTVVNVQIMNEPWVNSSSDQQIGGEFLSEKNSGTRCSPCFELLGFFFITAVVFLRTKKQV